MKKHAHHRTHADSRRRFVMHEPLEVGAERVSVEARHSDTASIFGFWMFLMTDLVLFASLFAAYAVLRGNTFGGPSGADIFDARYVLIETLLLLTSSFTCGLALLSAQRERARWLLAFLGSTALLGLLFVAMDVTEFSRLIASGAGPGRSGFLSAYFTLVGTHGLHVAIGIVWMLLLIVAIMRRDMTRSNVRKLLLMSLFWHFLDIVWIFIFTVVYMMGVQ